MQPGGTCHKEHVCVYLEPELHVDRGRRGPHRLAESRCVLGPGLGPVGAAWEGRSQPEDLLAKWRTGFQGERALRDPGGHGATWGCGP